MCNLVKTLISQCTNIICTTVCTTACKPQHDGKELALDIENFPDSSSAAMAVVEPLSYHEEQKLEEIYSVSVAYAKELLKGEAHKD